MGKTHTQVVQDRSTREVDATGSIFGRVSTGTYALFKPSGQPFGTLCSEMEVAAYIRWYSLSFMR